MNSSKAVPASIGMPSRLRGLRWSLYIAPLVLALAFLTSSVAAAEEEKCSDFMENNRPCTATEELGYCLTNAIDSYEDCKEGAGLIGKLGCYVAYDVDYWACVASLPVWMLKGALK